MVSGVSSCATAGEPIRRAAAIMAVVGRKELKSMNPKLENTQRTLKEDAQWAKELKN